MEPFATALMLAALGALLVVSVAISPVSQRLGVPALLLFLLIGIAAGSEGIGRIPFAEYPLAFRLGVIALVLILFDAGLNTAIPTVRRVAVPAALLATAGVLITALIVAGIAMLLGVPPVVALLIGSVVSSTDAAAVFSVLRGSGVRLKEETGALLEVESGLNDPMAMLLTVATTEVVLGRPALGWEMIGFVAAQFTFGVLGGVIVGWGGSWLLHRVHPPVAGLYPVLTTGLALAAFGLPSLVNGSGFLSVYIAALLLAGSALPYRAGVRRVHDALAWLAQVLMFLILGLLVFPSQLLPMLPVGFALALGLALLARPLAVLPLLAPFGFSRGERVFSAWVGLRGAVPIILATYPVLRGVPQGDAIFHLVFFVVAVNSLLPGASVAWLARRIGIAERVDSVPHASVELISLRDYPNEFTWYHVRRASAVAGAALRDLPLPSGCVVTMILRGDAILAPRGSTLLEPGDHVCVFIARADRPLADLLFGRAAD